MLKFDGLSLLKDTLLEVNVAFGYMLVHFFPREAHIDCESLSSLVGYLLEMCLLLCNLSKLVRLANFSASNFNLLFHSTS